MAINIRPQKIIIFDEYINATGRWRKKLRENLLPVLSTAISAPHVIISGGKAKVNAAIKKMNRFITR